MPDLFQVRLPHLKKGAVEKALASAAGKDPPPVPDISPPKSPEHQVQVTVEGQKPTIETSGKLTFSCSLHMRWTEVDLSDICVINQGEKL